MAAAAAAPFTQPQFLEVHLPFTQLPACLAGCTLWSDATDATTSTTSTTASASQRQQSPESSGTASKQSRFRLDKAVSRGIQGAADAPASSARGDGRFNDGGAIKKQ